MHVLPQALPRSQMRQQRSAGVHEGAGGSAASASIARQMVPNVRRSAWRRSERSDAGDMGTPTLASVSLGAGLRHGSPFMSKIRTNPRGEMSAAVAAH